MKATNFTAEFAARFKKPYTYAMGGSQTIVMPNGQRFEFDDRKYYAGRSAAKYNANIRHNLMGEVLVSRSQVAEARKTIAEQKRMIARHKKQKAAKASRVKAAASAGVYSIAPARGGGWEVELSGIEIMARKFDPVRLAATFKISIDDARLLASPGKTYVFAKSEDGNVYELYHPSLSCNYLSIWVGVASPERLAQFDHDKWASAPFAGLVGQTDAKNHFVC